ncbi:hypothetical protein GCM10023175_38020 [Pseudonocardia xishanensis]|uniref:Uncharacterized protein n=1 Tax=Pseudonocardia xishanensis TaxID=630995 RepID=A0ABP8RVQ9_9PSEU
MTRGDQRGELAATLFAGQVDLRGPAAAGTAQAVVGRFVAGRLGLLLRTASGSGGVLVGAVDRGVDRDVPAVAGSRILAVRLRGPVRSGRDGLAARR